MPSENSGDSHDAAVSDTHNDGWRRRARAARIVRIAGVLLALAGWWLSMDLLRLSGGMSATNPLLQAQCGGDNSSGGCLSVLRSSRARIGARDVPGQPGQSRGGLPVAVLGLGYFGFVGIWFAFVGPPDVGQRRWLVFVAAVVGAGLLFSLNMTNVMATVLKTWCIGCLLTHAVNAGLGILVVVSFFVGRLAPKAGSPQPSSKWSLLTILCGMFFAFSNISYVQLAAAAASVGQLNQQLTKIISDPEYVKLRYRQAVTVQIPLRKNEPWLGAADAPNTVVAFVDFQCGVCRAASRLIDRAVRKYPGKLRVAYRNFPQDSACNANYPQRAHPAACAAARAAEAALSAAGADSYHKMHDLLYERQRDLELDHYGEWASELGIDAAAFANALQSPAIEQRIREDVELGSKLGVKAVPVIFLNGKRLRYWQSAATWDALLSDPVSTQPTQP